VRLLLDTHVLLWALQDDPQLGVQTRELMHQAEVIMVSVASIWEAQIKADIGKLALPETFLAAVAQSGFSELTIGWEAATAISAVVLPHRDPFDRLLITQAEQEELRLVTADEVLLKAYPEVCLDAHK
jgi:PIN domain nuclease of toxin-antitoxin system